MAGNNIRCVAKYLYDKGYIPNEDMTVESASGVHHLKLFLRDGKVNSVSVDMGEVVFDPAQIPVKSDLEKVIGARVSIGGEDYNVTCLSVGNPHCVVFTDSIDSVDLTRVGPLFEYDPMFPERINTEFVRLIDRTTLRIRVWERGNGETLACGTGACAAVVAAVENGYCLKDEDIVVRVKGGELIVRYTDKAVYLTGNAELVFEGTIEY
jgi:carbamoyl-phosphate synthase large subunit